ncbi:MAG: histidinol-phosphate transaminase [Acidobacteriota bacterium]|nr:histidinol-phosphate transaminase [Acidobacteriota bacterium]
MSLVPASVASLESYQAGRSVEEVKRIYGLRRVVKLASNENPLGPSPLAVEAMKSVLGGLNIYPTGGLRLREVLAREFDTKVGNVIAGSGSEGIMSNIFRTFLDDDDEVLTADVTFIGFRLLAQSRGVAYRTVPLKDWRLDLTRMAEAVTSRTKIIYLANPNNPTGTIFTKQEFEAFYRHVPERVLIILDEAYFEYAKDNPRYPDSMHYRYDNVITLRTFSKAYGLAGARIGYGFAHEDLIGNLLKVKLPFEPSSVAEAAGVAAIADREFLHRTLEANARGMKRMVSELRGLGVETVPSEANFAMTLWPSAEAAKRVNENLLRGGAIARPLGQFGAANGIRITIGSDEENEILIAAMRHAVAVEKTEAEELSVCR